MEYERRWLLDRLPSFLKTASPDYIITQYYFDGKRLRILVPNKSEEPVSCLLIEKTRTEIIGVNKEKILQSLNIAEVEELLSKQTEVKSISKYRYIYGEFEIDKFLDNDLILLEREYTTLAEMNLFNMPIEFKLYIKKEVTDDNSFSNFNLAKPYK